MCEVRVQCKNKEQRLALSLWHALAGRKRTRSGSKLPAANSRSGSMKKGVASREFEKKNLKVTISHEMFSENSKKLPKIQPCSINFCPMLKLCNWFTLNSKLILVSVLRETLCDARILNIERRHFGSSGGFLTWQRRLVLCRRLMIPSRLRPFVDSWSVWRV